MKDALKVALEYLCDELDLEVRTGALYSLYGIYFHQIDRPKVKVNFIFFLLFSVVKILPLCT